MRADSDWTFPETVAGRGLGSCPCSIRPLPGWYVRGEHTGHTLRSASVILSDQCLRPYGTLFKHDLPPVRSSLTTHDSLLMPMPDDLAGQPKPQDNAMSTSSNHVNGSDTSAVDGKEIIAYKIIDQHQEERAWGLEDVNQETA